MIKRVMTTFPGVPTYFLFQGPTLIHLDQTEGP